MSGPRTEPAARLRAWADDWSVGRYEKPQYKNPGELKGDLRAVLDRLAKAESALEEIGLPGHVPEGFDPLEWWQHTACKRGEIARDALGVTAEELIAKKWHEHVEATR